MLQSKTTLVLGAGASKEYDLPTGPELAAKIAAKVNLSLTESSVTGDSHLYYTFLRHGAANATDYLAAGQRIRQGVLLSNSIDNFLDNHRDDEKMVLCGKLAIGKCLLDAERRSKLYFNPNPRHGPSVVPGRTRTRFLVNDIL